MTGPLRKRRVIMRRPRTVLERLEWGTWRREVAGRLEFFSCWGIRDVQPFDWDQEARRAIDAAEASRPPDAGWDPK